MLTPNPIPRYHSVMDNKGIELSADGDVIRTRDFTWNVSANAVSYTHLTVVSAEDNEPMIGVTIMQEGTSNGVVTDIDGNYTRK